MKPLISIIAAIGANRELGKDNHLLWHIPGELPRFKRITMGHPIIMGRKTFESIGRVLPGRTNIIVTRDSTYHVDKAVVTSSLTQAIQKAHQENTREIFIIGGGQIFEQALPLTDRLYVTLVQQAFDADVFFPEYSEFTKVIEEEEHEEGGYRYTFLTVEKSI